MKKTKKRGFTLIELMIVVAILGILAAVAIPAFVNYMKRAKTSEATLNLKSIVEGAVSYYDTHGHTLPANLPNWTPNAAPTAAGYTLDSTIDASFMNNAWENVGWKPHKNFLYRYSWNNPNGADEVSNTVTGVIATASAQGNLDGDATYSTFARDITKLTSGLAKPDELAVTNELE